MEYNGAGARAWSVEGIIILQTLLIFMRGQQKGTLVCMTDSDCFLMIKWYPPLLPIIDLSQSKILPE